MKTERPKPRWRSFLSFLLRARWAHHNIHSRAWKIFEFRLKSQSASKLNSFIHRFLDLHRLINSPLILWSNPKLIFNATNNSLQRLPRRMITLSFIAFRFWVFCFFSWVGVFWNKKKIDFFSSTFLCGWVEVMLDFREGSSVKGLLFGFWGLRFWG